MKMTIRTAELAKALYRVQGIVDKKSAMPALSHVLLEVKADQTLEVLATDLDVWLKGSYSIETSEAGEEGAIVVKARQLYDIVKSLAGDTITLESEDNNWVRIKGGNSNFRLVGMAADEFPKLPEPNQGPLFSVPASDLVEMIDRTLFCVSTDSNRHNLAGIYCESADGNTLRMVATDGHRLAMAERSFDSEINIENGVIVPRKGFQELKRVLSDSGESIATVEMSFGTNSGILKAGTVVLYTQLIEGQFPDYQQVIPKSSSHTARIGRSDFAEALRRIGILAQGRASGVKLTFSDNNLELAAQDPEFGEANENMPIEFAGDALTVGFNARYILDVLALAHDEAVSFELSDELSPGVLRPVENGGFLAVVMPMRI